MEPAENWLSQKLGQLLVLEILKKGSPQALISEYLERGLTLEQMGLQADCYQIILCESFSQGTGEEGLPNLWPAGREEHGPLHFREDGREVILLKGDAPAKFAELAKHWESPKADQRGGPLSSFFVAYGRPVSELSLLSLSYRDACELADRRFFCPPGCHILGYGALDELHKAPAVLDERALARFTDSLTGFLQTFNRAKVSQCLEELAGCLGQAGQGEERVRLFLTNLFLNVRERIRASYPLSRIPFENHLELFSGGGYLSEVLDILSEQCEAIMRATENPARNNVMDDVLSYIEHNYSGSLRLENIAPLFGYNSAYLGKLFYRTVGENFNSYVDRRRVEKAKRLLTGSSLKVYQIAEAVGYRNVDYFHKKFRRYAGMSPAEYRKRSAR